MKHHQSTSFSTLHLLSCCACFIFLLLTRIQVGRGPITFSSARDNMLPPTRQKPSSRLTHFLLSSMLPFPSLGAAPNAFFFLSNSSQRPMETYGNPFWWSKFCMKDSQEPSLKAFSQINRPVLLLILTLPRQFQNIEHSMSQIINEIHIFFWALK